ncbi:MAG TPA: alpha/beta hydrolase [Clostridia bacterium]|nr:alpha/beta hydrolase [Clostridia bacterium]
MRTLTMMTYVLVGGAWLPGAAWEAVADDLRGRGHTVHPVTLPGIGERRAEATSATNLDTYIEDVVSLIEHGDLHDVVLVGHSYSGIVISGVAPRVASRLGALVYVDSAPFEAGEAYVDVLGPDEREALERSVREHGDGWLLPPPELGALGASTTGLDASAQAILHASMTPQPWATWMQPLRLTGAGRAPDHYRRIAIACDDMRQLVAMGIPRMTALTREPWEWTELATGHWPMVSAPADLSDALDGIAGGGR